MISEKSSESKSQVPEMLTEQMRSLSTSIIEISGTTTIAGSLAKYVIGRVGTFSIVGGLF